MADKYLIHGAAFCGDGTTSAEAVGSTVTITIASPGVVSWTAHGLAADAPVYFTTTGALPTGLVAGTKYYVRNPTTDAFEVSATAGGVSINTSGTQSGTHTARGVGAWNDINVFTGTTPIVGTLAAGDTVYIRSKTSANANITLTYGASGYMGSSAATVVAPITWILDAGAVWSGVTGALTLSNTGAYTITARQYNNFIGATDSWILYLSTTYTAAYVVFMQYASGTYQGFLFDFSLADLVRGAGISGSATASVECTFVNPHFISKGRSEMGGLVNGSNYGRVVFINPIIELTDAAELTPVFLAGGYVVIEVFGGEIKGTGASSGVPVSNTTNGSIVLYGTKIPPLMDLVSALPSSSSPFGYAASFGADNSAGSYAAYSWGKFSSRNDGYYPTLNATLPNSSATPWSWWVYPSAAIPGALPRQVISKMYTDAASAKTITVELLVSTTFTTLNARNLTLSVSYTDSATNSVKTISSTDPAGGSLASSLAEWTATTYGAINFNKIKISVTTPTSIKQNSLVTAVVGIAAKSAATSDVLFIDPDIQLS